MSIFHENALKFLFAGGMIPIVIIILFKQLTTTGSESRDEFTGKEVK